MQEDLPTLSYDQYESIIQLERYATCKGELLKHTTVYPDKLSLFLKNYLEEINNKSKSKIV